MANRKASSVKALVTKAAREGDVKTAAVGAAVAAGALAAAKLARNRLCSGEDSRRFRLGDDEPAADGIRRVASGQLDMAIERLEGRTDEDVGKAVHEARKSFKRLRGAVRLARDELGDDVYRRENGAFRDAGRRLAGARDSAVLLETLDAVSERVPADGSPPRLLELRKALAGQHERAQRDLEGGVAVAGVLAGLRDARARVPEWPLERDGLDALAPGLKRIYRRGRRAYQRAKREPSVENLHELRKRVKDVWYAAQIVRPASPKRMKRLAREAHALSDLIGEDHDLAILWERARQRRDHVDDETIGVLADLIERRRNELQAQAMKVGKRVFRKRPRKVVRALENPSVAS